MIGEHRHLMRNCLISLLASCVAIALSAVAARTLGVTVEPLGALMLVVIAITLILGTWPGFISATLAMGYAACRVGTLVDPPAAPVSTCWPLLIASSALITAALRANLLHQAAATPPGRQRPRASGARKQSAPRDPIAATVSPGESADAAATSTMRHTARLALAGQMTAATAHELRQPLAASAGFIEATLRTLERRGIDNIHEQLQHLRDARDQVALAGQIIHRTLTFLRQGESERKVIDIHETIRQSLAAMRADAQMHDVTLSFEPDAQTMFTLADAIQVQQVVCNLVHNAVDAVVADDPPHRQVRLTTRCDVAAGRAYVTVTDTGPGVPEGDRDRLFHAFHTTRRDGTGLGLWICRDIVRQHGGDITLLPPAPHAGATFEFWLPLGES